MWLKHVKISSFYFLLSCDKSAITVTMRPFSSPQFNFLLLQTVTSWISAPTQSCHLLLPMCRVQARRFCKTERAQLKAVRMPYVDTQVQCLSGWYSAIILPCTGLITLAPLPQSISVWRTRLAGFWQLLSDWVNLLWSMPACTGWGEEELSGGHGNQGCCHCYGKITRGFIC